VNKLKKYQGEHQVSSVVVEVLIADVSIDKLKLNHKQQASGFS
jgi:hypothetical protein